MISLGLTALSKKDREDLLGAPVSTEGLFGSVSSVTQRFSRLEEERVQLSRMLSLAPPPTRYEALVAATLVDVVDFNTCFCPSNSRFFL